MSRLRATVPCLRPAETVTTDDFGNTAGEARAAIEFTAAFQPPTTMAGSQIVDGVLREATTTKPLLMVEPTEDNAAAFEPDAIRSGDPITLDGKPGWEVDGDPADWTNALSGKHHLMMIELRRTVG